MTHSLAVRLRALSIAWPAGVLAASGWVAFVLATERWRPWNDAIRLQYATDVEEYETIARAAPGFPSVRIQTPHADRWVPEWFVGSVHAAFGIGLHATYAVCTGLVVAGSILAVLVAARRLTADGRVLALVVGAFVASAYPVRYLLEAPGMLTDALFVLGLALASLALVRIDERLLVASLVVAALGRQTAVPLAVVAAGIVVVDGSWRAHRIRTAALAVVLPVLAYVVPHETSSSFAKPNGHGLIGMTVGGNWTPHSFASHVARCAVALAIPAALLAVGWLRGRRAPLWGPFALGVCVVAQAFVLAPDWSHAEPRLVGLALPALLVSAAPGLAAARLALREAVVVAAGIGLASLHHLYAYPVHRTAEWAALVAAGFLCCLLPLRDARPRPA